MHFLGLLTCYEIWVLQGIITGRSWVQGTGESSIYLSLLLSLNYFKTKIFKKRKITAQINDMMSEICFKNILGKEVDQSTDEKCD